MPAKQKQPRRRFGKRWTFILVTIIIASTYWGGIKSISQDGFKAGLASLVQSVTGRELTINGKAEVVWDWKPLLRLYDVHLANPPDWQGEGNFVSIEKLSIRFDLLSLLMGKQQVSEISMIQPHVSLVRDAKARDNWQMDLLTPKETTESADSIGFDVDVVRLYRAQITYQNMAIPTPIKTYAIKRLVLSERGGLGARPIDLNFKIDQVPLRGQLIYQPVKADRTQQAYQYTLDLVGDPGVIFSSKGDVRLLEDTTRGVAYQATLRLNVADPKQIPMLAMLPPELLKFEAVLTGDLLEASVSDYSLSSGRNSLKGAMTLTLPVDQQPLSLDATTALIVPSMQQLSPALQDKPLNAEGRIQFGKGLLEIQNLHIQAGTSEMTANIRHRLPLTGQQWTGDITAKELNSADFLHDTAPAVQQDTARIFWADWLAWQGTLTAAVQKLDVPALGSVLHDVELYGRGDDQQLHLKTLTATLPDKGGDMRLTATVQKTAPYALSLQIDTDGKVWPLSAVKKYVSGGRMSLSASLQSQGLEEKTLLRKLAGKTMLVLEESDLAPDTIDKLSFDFLDVLPGGGKQPTRAACVVSPWVITDGIWQSDKTWILTDDLEVSAKMRINPPDRRLKMVIVPSIRKPGLGKTAVPVGVQGSFDNPNISPDLSGFAVETVKNLTFTPLRPLIALLELVQDDEEAGNCLARYKKTGTLK